MTSLHFDYFDLNRKTVEQIAHGTGCRKLVAEHGEMAKAYAEALAGAVPRGDADQDHKHYHNAFQVNVEKVHGITKKWPMTRVAAKVANTARHAIVIEFGFERKNKAGDVVGEEPGYFVLSDTLTWLEGFDTHRFFDEPTDEQDEIDFFEESSSIDEFGYDSNWMDYH